MLSIGFDPSFLDTIVRAVDKTGSLLSTLPSPGHHHRMNEISRIAGGNNVNVAYVLMKLGFTFNLVVPANDEFEKYLNERGLTLAHSIHEDVNETIAVIWQEGEIQFNNVQAKLDKSDWSQAVHSFWMDSSLHVLNNWGLNPTSHEWIACQLLANAGWSYEEIQQLKEPLDNVSSISHLSKPLIIEPGSIQEHSHQEDLFKILNNVSELSYDRDFPLFCANEEEKPEYEGIDFKTKIIHSATEVLLIHNGEISKYDVPLIEEIVTLVGAGDAFLAGIIAGYLQSDTINVDFAVSVAQAYIKGDYF